MSLRTRAIVVFLASAVVALVAFVFAADRVVGRGFAELEQADAEERVERALAALTTELDRQVIATRELAFAADTTDLLTGNRDALMPSRQLQTRDAEYDAMLVLDPFGAVAYTTDSVEDLPTDLAAAVRDASLRLPDDDSRGDVRALVSTGTEIATVTSYLVPGPDVPIGSVLTVDVITDADIDKLSRRAFLELGLTPYQERRGIAFAPFETGPMRVMEEGDDLIATTQVVDAVGLFVASLSSDVPRGIAAAGEQAYRQLIWMIAVATLLVAAATTYWFERYILSRLERLTTLVVRSDEPDRAAVRIDGSDELAQLADRIETTLASLEVAQEELRDTNAELQAANELKDDFVSMVSHEFRTPLTSIRGYAETLLLHAQRLDDDQRTTFVEKVLSQSMKLNRMVDDLLTLSQARKGTMHVDAQDLVLAALVRDTLETMHASDVEVSIPGTLTVHADQDHVQRILTNYLENAFKYGASPIRVAASRSGSMIDLRVEDRGPGVPEEFRQQLFDRFTQASVGTQRTARGVGLGLSIVRTLASENGGEAWYEPNDPGSAFGVRLPAGNLPTARPPRPSDNLVSPRG